MKMKLVILLLLLSTSAFAQESEADLQLPVTDISDMQKEEEESVPTLEEVQMRQPRREQQRAEESPAVQKDHGARRKEKEVPTL